jgi:peroxiredoxin
VTAAARSETPPAGLVGSTVPGLVLPSTAGPVDLAELAAGLLVLFVYPHATGLPEPPVPGWDDIPGARGCTAQACAFRDANARLRDRGAEVAGLSAQRLGEQRQFAARVGLAYPLISDLALRLGSALGLPTFTASGRVFYRRITLVATGGRIAQVIFPVAEPERNAEEVLAWLEESGGRAASAP